MKREAEYLKNGGVKCPYCQSKNISSGNIDWDEPLTIKVSCDNCEKTWRDVYRLVGMIEDTNRTTMTKRQASRRATLLPNGKPKYVRCYDNGGTEVGGTIDRYTVVFSGRYTHKTGGEHSVLGMSGSPFHPQGVGIHSSYQEVIDAPSGWAPAIGRKCYLGTRILFDDLPPDCQKFVVEDYLDLWDLAKD